MCDVCVRSIQKVTQDTIKIEGQLIIASRYVKCKNGNSVDESSNHDEQKSSNFRIKKQKRKCKDCGTKMRDTEKHYNTIKHSKNTTNSQKPTNFTTY